MNKKTILIFGDVLVLAILTVIGFATHGETNTSYLPRMAAAFVPVTFAWFVLAPWFDLFDEGVIADPKNFWRILLVMLFVSPTAVILRGAWLNAPVLPLFAFIFGGSNAMGMIVWRWIYIFLAKRMK